MTAIQRLQETGIRRTGSPRSGFRYYTPRGSAPTAEEMRRIKVLKIPPAWKEVAINRFAHGKLQAVGKDKAGRWQYRYHDLFRRRQDEKKYQRLLEFGTALPKLRRTIGLDLRRPPHEREAILACILRILSTCFLRPGSQVYADENGTYGIATIYSRHVQVSGDRVTFQFRGKAGKEQRRELRDRRMSKVIRHLKRHSKGRLFKYQDGNGNAVPIRRRTINAYLKQVMGQSFSAKDFRTWAGTLVCACALGRAGVCAADSQRERKRKIGAAIRDTAELLGNTPAICRSSYVQPSILSCFNRGQVVSRYFTQLQELIAHRSASLHPSEKALLALLRASTTEPASDSKVRARWRSDRSAPLAKAA